MIQKVTYPSVNTVLFPLLPSRVERLLDVGCGTGALGQAIKSRYSAEVDGITYSDEEHRVASKALDRVWLGDLNTFAFEQLGVYDCIVCSHVLEHLYDPWDVLRRMKANLSPSGTLIVALPNALEIRTRLQFLRGRFRYSDWGILDRTHYRFFDLFSARELIDQAGFRIDHFSSEGSFPMPVLRPLLGNFAARIDAWANRTWPGLVAFQFVFRCTHADP